MIRKAIIVVLTLAAVGTGILWVASYLRPQRWTWIGVDRRSVGYTFAHLDFPITMLSCAVLSGGVLEIEFVGRVPWKRGLPSSALPKVDRKLLFVRFETTDQMLFIRPDGAGRSAFRFDTLYIALWGPFVLFATYPTIAFIRGSLRRWRRRRKGLCLKCGYDLTGNESGTCSECGEEVES